MIVAEMMTLRRMSGLIRRVGIKEEYNRGSVKVGQLNIKIQESSLRWFLRVERRVEESRTIGKKKQVRPKVRWSVRFQRERTEDRRRLGQGKVEKGN